MHIGKVLLNFRPTSYIGHNQNLREDVRHCQTIAHEYRLFKCGRESMIELTKSHDEPKSAKLRGFPLKLNMNK
jgi:hypothetical protein